MNDGLSTADILALTRDGRDGDDNMWNNPFVYLVWLAVLGGGGLWNNRAGTTSTELQGAVTRSDLFEGFNNQEVNGQLRGITNGLCDGFYALNNSVMQGFNGVDRALCQGFSGTNANIAELGYQMKDCCCGINRNIDAVRYEAAKNTCDITNAIHNEGEATRALINSNTMQALRDKLADRDRDLMTANFQLSQQAQSAALIGELRPCAKPAYITCSPYTTASFCGAGCGV